MSESVETVQVMPWSESQGDFVVINKSDFDPKKHKMYDPKAGSEKEPAEEKPKPTRKR